MRSGAWADAALRPKTLSRSLFRISMTHRQASASPPRMPCVKLTVKPPPPRECNRAHAAEECERTADALLRRNFFPKPIDFATQNFCVLPTVRQRGEIVAAGNRAHFRTDKNLAPVVA